MVIVVFILLINPLVFQVSAHLKTYYSQTSATSGKTQKLRKTVVTRVNEAVKAIALCHNVTPVYESDDDDDDNYEIEADQQFQQKVVYQASSPDEVCRPEKSHNKTVMHRNHLLV